MSNCPKCGDAGIHACIGHKQEPYTPEERKRLDAAFDLVMSPRPKTLRDEFAMAAMQAYFTDPNVGFGKDTLEAGAQTAYRIADAMLAARGAA